MRKIGYARVSTAAQRLDRQTAALRAEDCERIFKEKASGRNLGGRPQLDRAIDALGQGDCLVIAEWDRATRSMLDGIAIMTRVRERRATIKVLDKRWDLSTPIGQGLLALLSAIAEDERQRIVTRANQGRAAARARGVKFGRRPKLTPYQREEARARLSAGDTCSSIARTYGVSHSTISRLR